MLEDIIMLFIIAALLKTTTRRNYLGIMVFSYYAAFILLDLNLFGLNFESIIFSHKYIAWDLACFSLCLVFSLVASYFFFKGSNLAGMYSAWLIYNALLCLVNITNANSIDLLYNSTQNINLIIDLSVVVLGTDNKLHRTKAFGNFIDRINGFFDSFSYFSANNRA